MAKPYKIPDFRKMYPEASEEVIAVLRTSERKMQYQEYDLKRARNIVDPKTGEVMTVPSREDSYERLQEMAVQFPEEDRERTGAFEDVQTLLLGLLERHKKRRTVACDLREEQQHQDIPAPVGRAAQVARKTVREVGDPRLAPRFGKRLHFLYHQLRQLRSDLFNQILIHGSYLYVILPPER